MEAAPKHSGSDPTPTGAAIGAPVPFDLSRLALAQRDVALSSACELERLGELLLQEATDDTPFVRTAALRMQALAGALMSSFGQCGVEDVSAALEIVFGRGVALADYEGIEA